MDEYKKRKGFELGTFSLISRVTAADGQQLLPQLLRLLRVPVQDFRFLFGTNEGAAKEARTRT